MTAFEVESLTVCYHETPVLRDLSFSFPVGALCGVVGPNGGGKSTLLKSAMGLIKPLSGCIRFYGKALAVMQKKIAYVPQRESVDWDFPITVFDLVLMGRYGRLGLWKRPRHADREAVMHALEQVGMLAYTERQISQLSGGQQQRAFLARALVQDADLFLMDEPFSGIDLTTEQALLELFKKLKNLGKTVIIVFHDLGIAEQYFDYLVILNRYLIACGKPSEVARPEVLLKAFGKSEALFEEVSLLSVKKAKGVS